MTNPIEHIEYCHSTWEACPQHELVHQSIHTLDIIPRNLNTSVELRRGTIEWDELATSSKHTFDFVDDHPSIDVAFQVINSKIFEDIPVAVTNFNQSSATIRHLMECYIVTGELDHDDPLNVNIPESKYRRAMEGIGIFSD